jgi:hypothetical protein
MRVIVSTIVMGLALLVAPSASADEPGQGEPDSRGSVPCIGCW